ncbi:HNH endonuclease signature motif containing protein [Geodermatophilus aquaeductus]|uniref:HNH endonuclease n=1 Tax=Geodermatophilus aquaeductus TaxID=1564161 RepID=A0A521BRC7_9ACTN|nr:HNH endonuclease signature motif containing protein [Geodermatophilus aquaeductus]SMO49714.1 HNH endonuclease [Geodermatophilus aquaeductus]
MTDATDLPLDELARRITGAAVRLAAATAAWLALIAEFDRREGWGGAGIRSCAHWLAWQCGLSPGTAREHVRVARALTRLPRIRAAFASGRLSYSKVRALTRVAEPDTEAALLELAAETTAAQVERVVREWRRSDAVDEDTVRAKRRFEHWWDDDGMLHVRMCLDAEEGAAFLAGIDAEAERAARRDRAAAKRTAAERTAAERTAAGAGDTDADADGPADDRDEVALARERTAERRCAAAARLAAALPEVDRRAGDPPRREVVVHVDAAVLADDAAAGRAHLEGGPPLHAARVRRMLCEATVVTMLSRGREPLAVGRARRFATRAQRRALFRRDGGCARPGCPERRVERLHAHHLRHWLFGGATDVDNMVLLCDADHGLAHDLDLVMTRRAGELVAVTPDGRRVWGPADVAFIAGVGGTAGAGDTGGAPDGPLGEPRPDAAASSPVTRLLFPDRAPDLPDTLAVGGERMSLSYVVGVLLGNRDLERRLRAGNGGGLSAVA